MKFTDKLLNASRKNKSWLCIRLDPTPELMPEVTFLQFNKAIIDANYDLKARRYDLTMQHAYLYY